MDGGTVPQIRPGGRRAPHAYVALAMAGTDLALIAVFGWLAATDPTAASGPVWAILILSSFATGSLCRRSIGAPLVAAAVVPLEIAQGYLNPFMLVVATGSWLVGALFREHTLLAEQLRARSRELVEEQHRFAAESVRTERVRIARELHDIVGHSLSVVVLQAAAGERLARRSPQAAEEALKDIDRIARQAQHEIGALVTLLTSEDEEVVPSLAVLSDRLAAAAAATGLDITCRVDGSVHVVPGSTSRVAYRIIQEAVTNALRHAPGAPIRISVSQNGGWLDVEVRNGRPESLAPKPHEPAGGYGLRGMRDRAAECGGQLGAGPVGDGGWRVRTRLPVGS